MSQATTSLDRDDGSDPLAAVRRRAIMSCMIGNFLEIYDFTVFGFFATFIGQTFFPSGDPLLSLLSSFATLGVGFVMRPVGGLVMGAYADRFGRRGALIITMAMMAIGTALPGLTPGYATIGVWAPLILVICRLCAGVLHRRRVGRRDHFYGGICD